MDHAEKLFAAIAAGELVAARAMVKAEPELLDAQDAQGVTPIIKALYHGKSDIAESLAADRTEPTLFEAAALGRIELVRSAIDTDASRINAISPDGFPLLSLATFFGQFAVAELLVDRGADVNSLSTNGMNLRPIHAAAARNTEPTMRKLLTAGADANAQQAGGWTALHSAAKHGNHALVDLLLQFDADPSVKSDDGKTARDLAVESNHSDLAERLTAPHG